MRFLDRYAAKNEGIEILHSIEQGFYRHCLSFKCLLFQEKQFLQLNEVNVKLIPHILAKRRIFPLTHD